MEWKETRLSEITTKIGSGATPTGGSNAYFDHGISLIRSQNVLDLEFTDDGLAFISDEQADGLKNVTIQEEDVLLNITGDSVARVCKVPSSFLPARVNQHVAIIRADKKKTTPDYLLYYLHSIKEHLLTLSEVGATRRALTKAVIENLDVTLPPLPEQEAIAEVLSSLDDKIDLLHRQNKTLEAMAEALFRQWFVEEAQEDWEEVKLGDYVEVVNGVSYKSSELLPSDTAMVTLKNFNRNGSFRTDGFKEFVGSYKERQIVKEGDLVVAHTDITQEADVIGNPVLVINDPRYKVMVISMDLVKVIPKEKWLSIEFLYLLMRTEDFKYHCLGNSNGSTVLHLSKKAIPSYEFKIPSIETIEFMTTSIKPTISKIFKNISQIRTLTQLRNTLLPKLMSGEVRVKME